MSSFNLSNDSNLNLIKEIVKYLSPRDISSLSQVSKYYNRISKQFDYKFKEVSYKQFCSTYETFNIEITPQSNPKLLSFSLDISDLKQERVIDDNALHSAGSSLNICWKELGNIGIFLKQAWKTYNNDTKHMDMIIIRDIVYDRLMESKNIPKLRVKNTIVETEFNSPMQKFLYDFLYEEQELYEEYNNLFVEMKFCGEMGVIKDSGRGLPFNYFITDYAMMKKMIKTDGDKEQLLYARWYYIIDKPKINGAKGNKAKNADDDMLMIDGDSFKKNILFNFKDIQSSLTNIQTRHNNNKSIVITIDLIKSQLTTESNPLFFLLKCLTMTLKFYCHYTMIYLQSTFTSSSSQYSNHHILLSEYLKRYKNYVETAISLNALFENVNVTINFLYEYFYENHPSFPKFSVFRLCMLIWNEELTTPIEDNEPMLSSIKMSFISLYHNTLHTDLDYYFNNPSYIYTSYDSHPKSSHSSASYTLITNDPNANANTGSNANVNKESSSYSNRDSTSQYIIIEQILTSIIDTFCNEYTVFSLNLFKISSNSTYEEIEGNIMDTIENEITHYYQSKVLTSQSQSQGQAQSQSQSKTQFTRYAEDIIKYFTSGFYSERIINQLRLKILSTIHQVFNNIINNQIRNTFEAKMITWNIQAINESQAKEYLMHNSNNHSFKSMQIYNLLLESLTIATPQSVSQIVREYIVLKYLIFITADKTCSLFNIKFIDDWFNEENVKILKKSKQVFKVIEKREIPTEFNQSQMELLSLFERPGVEAFTKEHSDIDVDMDMDSGIGIEMEDENMAKEDYDKYMQ